MPITSVEKNLDDLTITIVADFAAPLADSGMPTPTPARSSGSGVRRPIPRPSCGTTSRSVVAASTA